MKFLKHILSLAFASAYISTATAEEPQLIVNLVVGAMRSTDLVRYNEGFGEGGFRRLLNGGTQFTECYIDHLPTSTEASLATLATGTLPATHGVVSPLWYNRTDGSATELCRKPLPDNAHYPADGIERTYTASHHAAQTLPEALLEYSPRSRAVTVAHDAISAILLAGGGSECYWLGGKGDWTSADCYTGSLPNWVQSYNADGLNRQFIGGKWYGKYTKNRYRNTVATDITLYETDTRVKSARSVEEPDIAEAMRTTPAGNVAILEFSKRILATMLPRRAGEGVKLLNICLDTPRHVARKYGMESAEYEDMLYCLDSNLADFLTFLYAQVKNPESILVTLTSAHGSSPLPKAESGTVERFNPRQFEVIVNAFLSARYGQERWISGFHGNALYLNHDVIYRQRKSVAEIEEEVAKFALQFRGVAYAVTASSLQNHYFADGIGHLMQNGCYPRRSGNVLIALTQGRIPDTAGTVSASGSQYNYDRHVPLVICGCGVAKGAKVSRRVSTASIAPTVASLAGIARPTASDAPVIELDK